MKPSFRSRLIKETKNVTDKFISRISGGVVTVEKEREGFENWTNKKKITVRIVASNVIFFPYWCSIGCEITVMFVIVFEYKM